MIVCGYPAFKNAQTNPYNMLLYSALIEKGCTVSEFDKIKFILQKTDILHIHWPDLIINHKSLLKTVISIARLCTLVLLCRLKRIKIVWTVHNLMPHDAYHEKTMKIALNWFVGHCSGLIFLSNSSKAEFIKFYKLKNLPACQIIPHGHYKSVYDKINNKLEARRELALPDDAFIILFFGQIRPYKNTEKLLNEFILIDQPKFYLCVAGSINDTALKENLELKSRGYDNISLDLKFIPEDKVSNYFSAADVTVLPYKNILNSGVALLSLSFDCPVIVPKLGSLSELRDIVGKEWVHIYEGDFSKEIIESTYEYIMRSKFKNCNLQEFEWNLIADKTLGLYEQLIKNSK